MRPAYGILLLVGWLVSGRDGESRIIARCPPLSRKVSLKLIDADRAVPRSNLQQV